MCHGKCNRKYTACFVAETFVFVPRVRLKRRGKSSPHSRQRLWQCKPHREQDQIGTALVAPSRNAVRVDCLTSVVTRMLEEWPSRYFYQTESGL